MPKEKFEQSLKRLEAIVEKLERGDLDLDEALNAFEQGVRLSKDCMKRLDEAQRKVEILLKNADGSLSTEPLDPEEEQP